MRTQEPSGFLAIHRLSYVSLIILSDAAETVSSQTDSAGSRPSYSFHAFSFPIVGRICPPLPAPVELPSMPFWVQAAHVVEERYIAILLLDARARMEHVQRALGHISQEQTLAVRYA